MRPKVSNLGRKVKKASTKPKPQVESSPAVVSTSAFFQALDLERRKPTRDTFPEEDVVDGVLIAATNQANMQQLSKETSESDPSQELTENIPEQCECDYVLFPKQNGASNSVYECIELALKFGRSCPDDESLGVIAKATVAYLGRVLLGNQAPWPHKCDTMNPLMIKIKQECLERVEEEIVTRSTRQSKDQGVSTRSRSGNNVDTNTDLTNDDENNNQQSALSEALEHSMALSAVLETNPLDLNGRETRANEDVDHSMTSGEIENSLDQVSARCRVCENCLICGPAARSSRHHSSRDSINSNISSNNGGKRRSLEVDEKFSFIGGEPSVREENRKIKAIQYHRYRPRPHDSILLTFKVKFSEAKGGRLASTELTWTNLKRCRRYKKALRKYCANLKVGSQELLCKRYPDIMRFCPEVNPPESGQSGVEDEFDLC